MSDDRQRESSSFIDWAQLLAGVLLILALGVVVDAVDVTAAGLCVGVMFALLVDGWRQ